MHYHQSMSTGGVSDIAFEVILLAAPIARAGLDRAQDALDAYLDDTTTSSVKVAVENDGTLGGIVTAAEVAGWRDYGSLEVGDVEYLGVKFDLQVWS